MPSVFAGLLITDLSYLVGAAVFIALAFQRGVHFITPPGSLPWVRLSTPPLHPPPGVTKWIAFVWILGCILPLATILLCTPFGTGPMAAAVLVPYFVLLLAEYLMETWPKMVHSPVWPIIPILFQVEPFTHAFSTQKLHVMVRDDLVIHFGLCTSLTSDQNQGTRCTYVSYI